MNRFFQLELFDLATDLDDAKREFKTATDTVALLKRLDRDIHKLADKIDRLLPPPKPKDWIYLELNDKKK
ncbi:MAG: hypothetical protein EBU33_00940 [Sphingobacteriia bacterium]|nr:hypothetical protein [Sphingobacteriia bacterium]